MDERYLESAERILKQLLPENKKGYLPEAQYLAARLFVASTCDDNGVMENAEYREIAVDYLLRIEEIIGTKVLITDTPLIV